MPENALANDQKDDEAMKKWSDGKWFLFEDLVVYTAVIICNLGFDLFFNFMHALGLVERMRPVNVGGAQIAVTFVFGTLLVRKIAQWRYYA